MGKPFFTYMLRCADGSYYVGHTDDLPRRVAQHQDGGTCHYTSTRRPVHLAWSQEFVTREEAKQTEVRVKNWNRAKKDALARGDWAGVHEAGKKRWQQYHKLR